jgi:hypothetical protein
MNNKNIFLSQTDKSTESSNDISGKITYTDILKSIPSGKLEKPLDNWKDKYLTEWRWRFLKDKERHVVEISHMNKNKLDRLYFNRFGVWTKDATISTECDVLVMKEYYVYTNT